MSALSAAKLPECRARALPSYPVACLWPSACQLGEGPLWLPDRQAPGAGRLLWVDIHDAAVFGLDLPTGRRHRWALPWRVAWLIPSEEAGVFLAGRVDAFLRLRLWPTVEVLGSGVKAHERRVAPGLRLNDAKLDRWGRVWAGGMFEPDPSQPLAVLQRIDALGRLQCMDGGYRIGNGPTFSLDGRTLFHADSGLGCVWAYALTAEGELDGAAARRLWRQFPAHEGVPDGMCTDVEGALWIAHWGGACVTRYSSEAEPLARIELPATQVTSCAFGGEQGRQLFITTASAGLSPAEAAAQPLAGGVFMAELPVGGLPSGHFAFAAGPGTAWA